MTAEAIMPCLNWSHGWGWEDGEHGEEGLRRVR